MGHDRNAALALPSVGALVTVARSSGGAASPNEGTTALWPHRALRLPGVAPLQSAERLVCMRTAAPDFTVFADDAYAVHHLDGPPADFPRLLELAEATGNPDRVLLFGSTSKVTFASGGPAFMAASVDNLAHCATRFSAQSIGPNKVEQWRQAMEVVASCIELVSLEHDATP